MAGCCVTAACVGFDGMPKVVAEWRTEGGEGVAKDGERGRQEREEGQNQVPGRLPHLCRLRAERQEHRPLLVARCGAQGRSDSYAGTQPWTDAHGQRARGGEPGTRQGWHEHARSESCSVPSSCAKVRGNGSSMSSSCTPARPSACGLLDALASFSCTLEKTTSAGEGSGHPIELRGERAMAGRCIGKNAGGQWRFQRWCDGTAGVSASLFGATAHPRRHADYLGRWCPLGSPRPEGVNRCGEAGWVKGLAGACAEPGGPRAKKSRILVEVGAFVV